MATTAWMELTKGKSFLAKLDPKSVMWVLSPTEIAVGAVPLHADYIIDLSTETLSQVNGAKVDAAPAAGFPTSARLKPSIDQYRKSGRYLFELHGKTEECGSLKESLKKSLIAIETDKPGMLAELTKIKPRTRRIVAKDPKDLFTDQKLVKQFAESLMPGWYFGTNNSAQETKVWLQRACEIAGLKWGKDFEVSI